jgi:Lrp/AsnC family transcriptional regulator for asnA, asnC and gidA
VSADASIYMDEIHKSRLWGDYALNEKKRMKLKDVEVRLIAELMKNSRRSDRELAKAVGVSQPTVSRTIGKLEKEGKIKEYTMIPDFKQLGYNIMAVTFLGKQETEKEEERRELLKGVSKMEKETPIGNLIVVNGIGLEKGRMIINLFKDYSSFVDGLKKIKNLPHIDADRVESFLVDLNDALNFRILSMTELATHFEAFGKVLTGE